MSIAAALPDAASLVRENLASLAGLGAAALWPGAALRWAAGRAAGENAAPEIQRLHAAITADDTWPLVIGRRFHSFVGSMLPVDETKISSALIIAYSEGASVEKIVERYRNLVTTNSAKAYLVHLLDNLHVNEKFSLGQEFTIVPKSEIPAERPSIGRGLENFGGGYAPFGLPTAAIVREVTISPFFVESVTHTTMNSTLEAYKEILNLDRSIAISSAGSVMGLETYGVFQDLLLDAFPGGARYSAIKTGSRLPTVATEMSKEKIISGYLSYEAFRQQSNGAASIAEIVAERILGARRGPSTADRCLDLGIALESLLMMYEKNSSEISFKLRMRAAWLLGQDSSSRLLISNWIRALYNLRSIVAHGTAPPETIKIGEKIVSTPEAVNYGTQICSEIARILFRENRTFAWDRLTVGENLVQRDTDQLLIDLANAGSVST